MADGSGRSGQGGRAFTESEHHQVIAGLRPRAAIVHEIIREEGEDELARRVSALWWSGLAAGLSMGFSLVAEGLLRHHLPEAAWRPLIESFGYTVGFVIVVLGRQQLFTENTLTAVIPVLTRRDRNSLLGMARLWSVVLVANLVGAAIFAALAASAPVASPDLRDEFLAIAGEAFEGDFLALLVQGVLAGWLIALMVWLLPAAGSARLFVILLITYLVALGGFAHIIAGSVEVLYGVIAGRIGVLAYLGGYALPVLIGNVAGGTALVAIVNHAQVHREVGANAAGRRRGSEASSHTVAE